ncbi:MAG: transposase [Chitinispirillaceae bacterium]|nr:transposase [Chitinispirillaceae bacterium]
MFDPLDFLAAATQHIPNKGEHQIRYYGWYSNKRRGMNGKSGKPPAEIPFPPQQPDGPTLDYEFFKSLAS